MIIINNFTKKEASEKQAAGLVDKEDEDNDDACTTPISKINDSSGDSSSTTKNLKNSIRQTSSKRQSVQPD